MQLKVSFKQKWNICTLSVKPLNFVDQFTYLGKDISSTETDINMRRVEYDRLVIDHREIYSTQ